VLVETLRVTVAGASGMVLAAVQDLSYGQMKIITSLLCRAMGWKSLFCSFLTVLVIIRLRGRRVLWEL